MVDLYLQYHFINN